MGFWDRVTGRTTFDDRIPVEPPAEEVAPEPPAPEVSTRQSATAFVDHEVQLGDLVSEIAARHEVSTQVVIEANGLRHPERIYPGMQLRIPIGR